MAGPSNESSAEQLKQADLKYEEGRAALKEEDYDRAIELLGAALEIRVKHYGELAPECASTYFKYGSALFYKVQAEADAFGGRAAEVDKGALAEDGKEQELETMEEEEENEGEEKEGDEGDEELLDEDEGDMELAWKLLETAKVIHERQAERSVEEADVIATLADINLEKEDFSTSLQDYKKALQILEGLVQPDDRMLAELLFKICLCQQMAEQPQDALDFCRRAMAVCEARLQRLRRELLAASGGTKLKGKGKMEEEGGRAGAQREDLDHKKEEAEDVSAIGSGVLSTEKNGGESERSERGKETAEASAVEKEIKEIEALLVDIKEKEEDLLQQAAAPSLEEAMKMSFPEAVQEVRSLFSAAAASSEVPNSAAAQGSPSSSGFDAPQLGGSSGGGTSSIVTAVTDLGVVGRGVKRAAPIAVSSPVGEGQPQSKRMSVEEPAAATDSGV